MFLEWNLEKLIKLQDEDNYCRLLMNSLKKGYDVVKLREELNKHKKMEG